MAGRGPQTFKKRQKEQQRKEKQEEKRAKRIERKLAPTETGIPDPVEEDDLLMRDEGDILGSLPTDQLNE